MKIIVVLGKDNTDNPTTVTWTEKIAKTKMAEFIFFDYLNTNRYTIQERTLINKFNRIYNPKKVAKSSRNIENFTKREYKTIFNSALSYIQSNKLEEIIEEFKLELDTKMISFIEGDKGKEVIDEKLNELNGNVLSRIYEEEEVSKKAERGLELGLSVTEAKAYFLDNITVKNKEAINIKEYVIDGRRLFKNTDNVKLKKLKELGFKDIGFVTKENKTSRSLFSENEGRINLKESQDLYSSIIERDEDGKPTLESGKYKIDRRDTVGEIGNRSYQFQKVPFGNENTGNELQTVSDALMIKFGAEWEKANEKGLVKEYEELTKPIKKLKPVIDKYRNILLQEIREKYEGEDLEMGELKEEYKKYSDSNGNETLGEDYTINIDGKTKSITEAIVDTFMLLDNKALNRVGLMELYNRHNEILKLIDMIGNKKPYSFISSLIKPTDYRVDVKQGDTSYIAGEMKETQKAKTVYAKNKLEEFEKKNKIYDKVAAERKRLAEKNIQTGGRPTTGEDKKITHAEDMFEDESKVVDYFINQLIDLKHIYFIKVTIEKIPAKGKGKPKYAIRSNDKGKSEMLKQKIVLNRKHSGNTTNVVYMPKINYKIKQEASTLINTLNRKITLLTNIGSA